MPHRLMARVFRAALLALPLLLAGCYTWKPITTPLPTLLAEEKPSMLRVTLADGRVVKVANPRILGDTLYGVSGAPGRRKAGTPPAGEAAPTPVAPVADVTTVVQRHTRVRETIQLAMLPLLVGVIAFGVACQSGCYGF